MNKWLVILVVVLITSIFAFKKTPTESKLRVDVYPWQIEVLNDGRSRVFGLVLSETRLKEVSIKLKSLSEIALYESKEKLVLEAYYKNVSLGGLIGSFIFTLDVPKEHLVKIKNESKKKERIKNNEIKHKLDRVASEEASSYRVKNLIYIPRVQLDEETILKRFGEPKYKIKLKTKEIGWHYLYPKKGLDLIYKEEGKEVLQYVNPRIFNVLLIPLQAH